MSGMHGRVGGVVHEGLADESLCRRHFAFLGGDGGQQVQDTFFGWMLLEDLGIDGRRQVQLARLLASDGQVQRLIDRQSGHGDILSACGRGCAGGCVTL